MLLVLVQRVPQALAVLVQQAPQAYKALRVLVLPAQRGCRAPRDPKGPRELQA